MKLKAKKVLMSSVFSVKTKFITFIFFVLIYGNFYTLQSNPSYITPSKKYHIVKRDETLYTISKKYNIPLKKIKSYNNLQNDKIFAGQKIYFTPRIPPKREFVTKRKIPLEKYHTVKKGETMYRISKMYDLEIIDLMEYNNLETFNIKEGQKILLTSENKKVSSDKPPKTVTHKKVTKNKKGKTHTVKKGETLYAIAEMYGMKIAELKSLNNLKNNSLKAGQKLNLTPGAKIASSPAKSSGTNKKSSNKKKKIKSSDIKNPYSKSDLCLPVKGKILSEFGLRNNRQHKGIDIGAEMGEPIKAVLPGKVVFAGKQRGYGNVIVLEHDNYVMTVYAHNESNLVRLGDMTEKGQPIATIGKTGNASAPHVHFEYRLKGKAINPREVLPL
ncbi:MAG: hypothetical protein CSB55_06300 [Candidatus Cloacimonadota bacterium]|nr:MAG: hypothetical protein CSB55_06300 [Candidatus Cloacimonadota bacterium]